MWKYGGIRSNDFQIVNKNIVTHEKLAILCAQYLLKSTKKL